MTRKLKKEQRGPWCGFCEPKTTRATYRDYGFRVFACGQHKGEIEKIDERHALQNAYQTEGEYQAMRRGNY